MVALQKYEPYPKFSPEIEWAGDLIMRRRKAMREEARIAAHTMTRRTPIVSYPLMPWLLHQEALYRQQQQPAPRPQYEHPTYKVYHLRHGELPHNFVGDLAWKAVSFIGSFFDAWHSAHA